MTGPPPRVDLGDARSWPVALAKLLGADPNRPFETPPPDAQETRLNINEPLEGEVRRLLADHSILMYQASRLLPEEVAAIHSEGLRPQSAELRASKLDRLIARKLLSAEEAIQREQRSPVHGVGHEAR